MTRQVYYDLRRVLDSGRFTATSGWTKEADGTLRKWETDGNVYLYKGEYASSLSEARAETLRRLRLREEKATRELQKVQKAMWVFADDLRIAADAPPQVPGDLRQHLAQRRGEVP